MRMTCKQCHKLFKPQRAGAQYCSGRCRIAAHRRRHARLPSTRWLGERIPQLSSISRSFNADGTPALARQQLGVKLIEIADRDDDGEPKTGRRYYYLALSHGYIQPDMTATPEGKKSRDAAYHTIADVLGVLRKNGDLAWDMVLDLTRELVLWETYDSPREARAAMRERYDEDRWLGQPCYPILIVEKDTMEPICEPMAQHWQMPFVSSRGYGSHKLQYDVAKLLRDRRAKTLRARYDRTGQWAIPYLITDLDPSGLDLQRAWEQAFTDFRVPVFEFVRIGLTREQVARVRNPRLRQGIGVKRSDPRAKKFIEQYGDRCWEVDILPAATIRAALDAHIESWLDRRLWDRRAAEIEAARQVL
jgi:hypothetical protein